MTKHGWDASGAVLDEGKALKQVLEALGNLLTVHYGNLPVWKALREDIEKADPGMDHLFNLMLSATSSAIQYGIDIRDIPLKELQRALEGAIKDCDRIHKNLADILP
jgi:hypothetical protein